MPFTMSYGVTEKPAVKATPPAVKKPSTPRAVRATAKSKAAALFAPERVSDVGDTTAD